MTQPDSTVVRWTKPNCFWWRTISQQNCGCQDNIEVKFSASMQKFWQEDPQ